MSKSISEITEWHKAFLVSKFVPVGAGSWVSLPVYFFILLFISKKEHVNQYDTLSLKTWLA